MEDDLPKIIRDMIYEFNRIRQEAAHIYDPSYRDNPAQMLPTTAQPGPTHFNHHMMILEDIIEECIRILKNLPSGGYIPSNIRNALNRLGKEFQASLDFLQRFFLN